MAISGYQLVDFGDGRKLEQLGGTLVDRPAPAAVRPRVSGEETWNDARLRFLRKSNDKGVWKNSVELPDPWQIDLGNFRLQLKTTPLGQVGVFPEQSANWNWIRTQVKRADRELQVLNLFAYTGGSTLAAASAGANVTHIDAAKNIVSWARENAVCSQLADAPVRWIAEDAVRFVEREIKRGNRYDGLILDPPSYGHGPKGEVWKIQKDLMPLLQKCRQLLSDNPAFVLLTCHTPGLESADLQAMVSDAIFGSCGAGALARKLSLETTSGRKLHAGDAVRWSSV